MNYKEKYLAAYKEMKKAAVEKMKNYGKTLEVVEECKKMLMEKQGYMSASEIDEDELRDFKDANIYSCVVIDKHGGTHVCEIIMLRYNEEHDDLDVYLESEYGDISEWLPVSYVDYEVDAIYMTILDFIE